MIGQTLGHYRVVARLGEGGMGEVYRAVDEMLDRDVALKMLRPELAHRAEVADRFRAEAVTLAKLDHPNIARLHGMTRLDANLFMVMEFVPGETLAARVERQTRLPWRDAVDAIAQVLDGLAYAHRLGVVHRDVKPANLIIRPDGRVKVTDFGIARVLGTSRATRTGFIVGTLEYMAPEQIRGEDVDERADLYAAGIVLYQLVTGAAPFSATTEFELMRLQLEGVVPTVDHDLMDVPSWFDGVIARALAKSPDDRFESAAAFRAELLSLAAGEPAASTARATRVAAAPARPTRIASIPEPARAISQSLNARHAVGIAAIMSLLVTAPFAWRALHATHGAVAAVPVSGNAYAEPSVPPMAPPVTMPTSPDRTPVTPRSPAPRVPKPHAPLNPPVDAEPTAPLPAPAAPAAPDRVSPPAPRPSMPARIAGSAAVTTRAEVLFDEESLMVVEGKKTHERDIIVRFAGATIELLDRKTRVEIQSMPLNRIASATYSRSKQPRWKTASAGVILGGVFASPLFFLKGTQHWLTLEGTGDPVVIRLDKNSWERVIAEIEQRSTIKVVRATDEAKK